MTAPAAVSLPPAPVRKPLGRLALSPSVLHGIVAAGYTIVAADEYEDDMRALRHYQAGARAASKLPHCTDCEKPLKADHCTVRSPRCAKCQRLHAKLRHRVYAREWQRRKRAAAKGAK